MSSSSIKVAIRCRPLFGQERPTGGLDIQNRRILLDAKTYDPDYTFPPTATQDDVFHACRPILQCVKEGMNGTIMVYGQTGTGKTYTMLGNDDAEYGLVHKVVADMLDYVQQKTADGAQCALTLSMIEIYNEKLTDMLSPNGEEEVTLISGFPRFTHKATLCRVNDAIDTIKKGLAWRHTAATMMNDRSSRSHVVFIFDLEEYNAFTDQTDVAHLFMIDLAGSESLKKSQASGVAAGEAGKINKSLLALKSVFLALSNTNEATRPSHVPYRDSKLTELLQDSIGGTARTLMIACISSVGRDIEETKSTLLYAVKARSIRNAANTEREKLLVRLRSMEVENQKLRNRLQERVNERGGYYVNKEEHEQIRAMEESYSELKEAVEKITQERQKSDARLHIGESQAKLLQALLEDKTAELRSFKEVYYEALRRFEHQAATLQRMVRGGVADAKDAVQLSFADNYARLHSWRTELLNALEEPPLTAIPAAAADTIGVHAEEDEGLSSSTQAERSSLTGVSGERCATPPLQSQPQLQQSAMLAGRSTPPVSPMRSENASPYKATTNSSAAAVGGSRLCGPSRSARGSSASMQRISAASAGAVSASVSPTRRGNGRVRPGGNGGGASAGPSAHSSRRPTPASSGQLLSSPSLAAAHAHPPLLPMAPPLPSSVSGKDSGMGNEEEDGGAVVVEAVGPLLPSATAVPPRVSEPPSWPSVLAQHDVQCLRAVQRLNEAVVAMLEECLRAFHQYDTQATTAEERRQQEVLNVCQRLRQDMDTQLAQLQRAEAAGAREVREARGVLRDQLLLQQKVYPTADAAPFQHAVRNACVEVVRHATHAFPHPSTPASAEAVMDGVVSRVQKCSTAFSVHALDPLSSSAVALNTSFLQTSTSTSSSSAGSPLHSKAATSAMGSPVMLDLAPMPRLSPPLADAVAALAGSSSGGGTLRQIGRASPLPQNTADDEPSSRRSSSRSSAAREVRDTTVPPSRTASVSPSSLSPVPASQRVSTRPSSLRGSAALSAMAVNRVPGRSDGARRAGGPHNGEAGRCKRTRSTASSQGGERASRRTTTTHRGLR